MNETFVYVCQYILLGSLAIGAASVVIGIVLFTAIQVWASLDECLRERRKLITKNRS